MNRLLRAVPVLLFVAMAGCSAAPAAMAPAPTATPPVAAPALSGATPASPLPPPTSLSSTDVPAPAPAALANPAGQTVRVYNPSGVRADGVFIDEGLKKNMADVKKTRPPLAGEFPKVKVEEVAVQGDAVVEVTDLFYRRGWTDGLPIVPPTEARVEQMLKGTDLAPETVIGTIDPMGGQATVEKIAVNAVMAGCRPEYMPVLLTAVEAVSDPEFDLRGVATTTNPDVPMLIVSGPIAKQLDINAGSNALGRGWQANAAISRALHLIINNIGGSWPGVTDMSTLGQPGDFAMMLAENADASPWPPLKVQLGKPGAENLLTLVAVEGTTSILGIGQSSTGYMKLVADQMANLDRAHRSVVLWIVAQDTAKNMAHEGWNPDKMRQFIYENARLPYPKYKERFIDTGMAQMLGGVPPWVFEVRDPDAMIPTPFIDQLLIFVAGGVGEKSMIIPGWFNCKAITREIKLPGNWDELIKRP